MIFAVLIPVTFAEDPPQYQLTWLDIGLVSDINDLGTVVGNEGGEASMYDQGTGMQNLNDLDGVFWTDLNTGETWDRFNTPWKATWARGINVGGQIVGQASHANPDIGSRVFVLSFPVGSSPEFALLKRLGEGANQGARINDLGVVVGWTEGYTIVFDPRATPPYEPVGIPGPVDFSGAADPQEINNHGVIVTRSSVGDKGGCVISPPTDPQTGIYDYTQAFVDPFPNDEFFGINDLGMISGLRHQILTGKPSQRQDGGAFRFTYLDPFEYPDPGAPSRDDLLIIDNDGAESYGCDVNELGDVCFREGDRAWVSLVGEGIFNLDNYIRFDSPEDESDWLNGNPKQPLGINGKGQIIVRTWPAAGVRPALLTPIVPGPPTPGIVVSPTSGLVTTEAGGTDSFDIVLDSEPSADVTIGLISSNTSEGTVSPASLTFTQADWDAPQTVTVNGVDDAIEDGDQAYSIVTAAATSADLDYDTLNADDVQVTNEDDDSPPGGGTETYSAEDTPLNIPDRGTINSNLPISDDFGITSMTVTLSISHPRPSDLRVTLIGPGPDNTEVQLSNFTGDNNVASFNGARTIGLWTLEVRDVKKKKTGTLNGWSISVDY